MIWLWHYFQLKGKKVAKKGEEKDENLTVYPYSFSDGLFVNCLMIMFFKLLQLTLCDIYTIIYSWTTDNLFSYMIFLPILRELIQYINIISDFIFLDIGSNNSGFYDLQAVLTHKGRSSSSGHYVGWVRKSAGKYFILANVNIYTGICS